MILKENVTKLSVWTKLAEKYQPELRKWKIIVWFWIEMAISTQQHRQKLHYALFLINISKLTGYLGSTSDGSRNFIEGMSKLNHVRMIHDCPHGSGQKISSTCN